MENDLLNKIMLALSDEIPQIKMESIKNKLCTILTEYDIAPKCKALSTYVRPYPQCYEFFIVTKHIEGLSEKTLSLYRLYLEDMFDHIKIPLDEIGPNEIRAYLFSIQHERRISNRTLNSRRSCLSSFFRWSAAEGYISKNPMATIKPIKFEQIERQPLQAIDMETLRMQCRTIREKAIVEVLYSTACRVTELVRLNKSDVDFVSGEVSLYGKGNKHRTSYLSARAKLYLEEYLSTRKDCCDALFITEKGEKKRLTKSSVERIIRDIGVRAGMGRVFPHLLRHTSATDALQHGMDVTQVQAMLGHSNINTTMIYAKVSQDEVKRSHKKFIT